MNLLRSVPWILHPMTTLFIWIKWKLNFFRELENGAQFIVNHARALRCCVCWEDRLFHQWAICIVSWKMPVLLSCVTGHHWSSSKFNLILLQFCTGFPCHLQLSTYIVSYSRSQYAVDRHLSSVNTMLLNWQLYYLGPLCGFSLTRYARQLQIQWMVHLENIGHAWARLHLFILHSLEMLTIIWMES